MSVNSRQLIIDAAAQIFSRSGYHLSSMDTIAELAGVAKGTLYYHFPGKGALFRDVVIEGIDMLTHEAEACLVSDQDFTLIIRKIISSHVSIYAEYPALAMIVFNESVPGLDQQYFDQIKSAKKKHHSILANLFTRGCQQGSCKEADFNLTAECFTTLLDCTCRYHLRLYGKSDIEKITDTLYQMITHGLLV